MTTGSIIAAGRKARRLTQRQVADALNVTVQAVSSWETDKSLPNVDRANALAALLDISVYDLLPEQVRSISGLKRETADALPALMHTAREMQREGTPIVLVKTPTFDIKSSLNNNTASVTKEKISIEAASSGLFFAIKMGFSSEELSISAGDVLIFDSGVYAKPGDIVLFAILTTNIIQMRAAGEIVSEWVTIGRYEADGETPGSARIVSALGSSSERAPDGFRVIWATMVERRTFRA